MDIGSEKARRNAGPSTRLFQTYSLTLPSVKPLMKYRCMNG